MNKFVLYSELRPDKYRALLDEVGLTIAGAGTFFGYDDRTARRWVSGALPIPIPVAMVLSLMRHHRLTPDDVMNIMSS